MESKTPPIEKKTEIIFSEFDFIKLVSLQVSQLVYILDRMNASKFFSSTSVKKAINDYYNMMKEQFEEHRK